MVDVNFGRWSVRVDPVRTRHAYSLVPGGYAEECGCVGCLNFIALRPRAYSQKALDLFGTLGIDPAKEMHAVRIARVPEGGHLYGGRFHAIGEILSGEECRTSSGPDCRAEGLEKIEGHCEIGFRKSEEAPRPAFRFLPLVQVEFITRLPWVIVEPEPKD
jgi:hypothetical protein